MTLLWRAFAWTRARIFYRVPWLTVYLFDCDEGERP